jgi:hypothetical protein
LHSASVSKSRARRDPDPDSVCRNLMPSNAILRKTSAPTQVPSTSPRSSSSRSAGTPIRSGARPSSRSCRSSMATSRPSASRAPLMSAAYQAHSLSSITSKRTRAGSLVIDHFVYGCPARCRCHNGMHL